MSDTDRSTIHTFFFTDITGGEDAFTYTDYLAATYTCRYMGGIEEEQFVELDSWRMVLRMAEEAA
ncbi:MAG: hypothetical protein QGH25_04540, partial [Candidatus Latescibacteria bacterium]|nr:hypothetical protein [Candidatus Latescibacterota bacterium]